jgi:hypothetical protein
LGTQFPQPPQPKLQIVVNSRLWFSADANFWYGGATSLNGLENANASQKNSQMRHCGPKVHFLHFEAGGIANKKHIGEYPDCILS